MNAAEPTVLLESFDRRRDCASYAFSGLVAEITAAIPAEVLPALQKLDDAVACGFHAAGFISYEAASGLGPGPSAAGHPDLPLLWFGVFRVKSARHHRRDTSRMRNADGTSDWSSSLSAADYVSAVERIKELIAAGDVYQVNMTMQRRFRFEGEPAALYRQLCLSQQAPYCAFLDMGRYRILSASPELFFRLESGTLTVRPMKGTAPRGRWWEEDQAARETLRADPKERAENLMIVDLLRNDLGKISQVGSVKVASLFDVETLPTLHQLTSTITSRLCPGTPVSEILRALFPSGSITGAPKKRAMEIVDMLETSPRGVYTGCIGYVSPGSGTGTTCEAVFNVAIRTAVLDVHTGTGVLGVGSGITWDSRPDMEYAECLAKGGFARSLAVEFNLIETMLFEEKGGFFLLERHLERIRRSAEYFGFTFRPHHLRTILANRAGTFTGNCKVRITLSPGGKLAVQSEAVPAPGQGMVRAAFAAAPVDSGSLFLYHKTTNRRFYEQQRSLAPDCDELLFWNERGEVTEGMTTSIVARLEGGELVTPPLHCGLLPGVFRQELLARKTITERVITRQELERAVELHLVNSVRKWRRAVLIW